MPPVHKENANGILTIVITV